MLVAYIIGALIGFAILLFAMYRDQMDFDRAKLWANSIKGSFKTRVGSKVQVPLLTREWEKMMEEMQAAKMKQSTVIMVMVFIIVMGTAVMSFVEKSIIIGALFGLIAGFVVTRVLVKSQYKKMKAKFLQNCVSEAIPIAAHTLQATDQLENAFEEVAKASRSPRIREAFGSISALWKAQNVTPAEAFYRASLQWDIPELEQLAILTKETEPYHPNLGELWLTFNTQLERDLQYNRMMKSKTSAARRNGMLFLWLVLGGFSIAFPRLHHYMTPMIATGFWMTIGVVSLGGWMMYRTGQSIQV